jgi:hypothetical protein
MIDKDELPLEAVSPTPTQRIFLEKVVEVTSEYARSRDLNDMYFQGHSDQTYFGAYSTKIIRRGAGKFIFGFARRGGILHFAYPIDVPEPYRLARSWTGDPTRNRAIINLDDNPDEEIQLYILDMAKRSIDYHYEKLSKRGT